MSIVKREGKNGITYLVDIYLTQQMRVQLGKDRIHKTFSNLKEAQKWEVLKRKEMDSGYLTIVDDLTIAEASKEFIYEMRPKWSSSTVLTFVGYVKNYFIVVFKEKPLNKFTPLDLQRFNKFLDVLPNRSEKTKHNISSFLRSLLKWCREKNYVDTDLREDIAKYSQKPVSTRDFLVIEEIKNLISNISDSVVQDLVTFMVFTGMRISEVCGLQFSDIDFEKNSITVTKQIFFTTESPNGYIFIPPKCNNVSSIILNDVALSVLTKQKGLSERTKSDFVFCDSLNKPFRKDGYIKHELLRAVNKMKEQKLLDPKKNITFHSLRHTYASMLVHMNENIFTVQHLLRHKDFRLTYNTYAHMYPNQKPESFTKINNVFSELLDK